MVDPIHSPRGCLDNLATFAQDRLPPDPRTLPLDATPICALLFVCARISCLSLSTPQRPDPQVRLTPVGVFRPQRIPYSHSHCSDPIPSTLDHRGDFHELTTFFYIRYGFLPVLFPPHSIVLSVVFILCHIPTSLSRLSCLCNAGNPSTPGFARISYRHSPDALDQKTSFEF